MNNDTKINSKIVEYNFNKNKFSLSKQSNVIKNKDLNYCKKYSIKNNKAGFNFYGKNPLANLTHIRVMTKHSFCIFCFFFFFR